MLDPVVSIITPAYNHERFIGECIESVLAQSFTAWEQIVVDDGSSDRTAEVVESYRDPRIRCIRLPHRGLASLAESYNTALSVARGKFVAILEGDDRWPADKLALQLPAFEDPGVSLSWGRATLIDENGAEFREYTTMNTSRDRVYFDRADLFARLIRINALTPTNSVIVRRSALDRVGGFRQTGSAHYVDLPTWLWLSLLNEGRACFLNRVLAHYRVHRTQTTQRFRREMEAEHLQIVLAIEQEAPPSALETVGWNAGMRADALLAGVLAQGVGCLATGDFRGAGPLFARALHDARSARDRAKALLGLTSSALRVDLLRRAYSVRSRLIAMRGRR